MTSNSWRTGSLTANDTESRISATPLDPGPPGLVRRDPMGSPPPSARLRISESSMSPFDGSDQSSGAATVAQSKSPLQELQSSVCS